MMSLENALWLAGTLSKAALIALLFYRRAWRTLPVFTLYCVWDILLDAANIGILHFASDSYLGAYLTETAIDSVLQFCVIVELAWSVLRPIRASLTRAALVVIAGVILVVGAAIWPFSNMTTANLPLMRILIHLLQTVTIVRIIFFLALAGCSQLLSLSWKDRELQVATGLGLYSIVSLGIAMLHAHDPSYAQYKHLNEFGVGSYICALLYWVVSFAQKEPERKEFTPQMENLLLAMAGVARTDRAVLARTTVTDARDRRDR
ncbi:MAG TPA: hypothetical protein VE291_08410 [Terracidiphilus sp.]|jgi:hypothetical protein|nr:hypothetical protein [Terracidiphilus sp.]